MFKIYDNKVEYIIDNQVLAYVTFPSIDNNIVLIDHTVVDPSLQGQGIASKLMEYAYIAIKTTNRKAKLSCSYAISWYIKNEMKKDIISD